MDYNNNQSKDNMNSLFAALASENKGSSPQPQQSEQSAPSAANPACPTCGQVQSVMPGSAGQGPSFGNIA